MYKTELVHKVARETRLSQRIVSDVLKEALQQISRTVAEGRKVTLPGFGLFEARHRSEGTVRDIRTGETITYPARLLPIFRAGELFKSVVRKSKSDKPTKPTKRTKKK